MLLATSIYLGWKCLMLATAGNIQDGVNSATTTNSVCILSGVKTRLLSSYRSWFYRQPELPCFIYSTDNLDVYLGKAEVLERNTMDHSIDND